MKKSMTYGGKKKAMPKPKKSGAGSRTVSTGMANKYRRPGTGKARGA